MRQLLFLLGFGIFFSSPFTYAIDRIDLSIGNISRPTTTSPLLNSFRVGVSWDSQYLQANTNILHSYLRFETSAGINNTALGTVKDFIFAPVLHYHLNGNYEHIFIEASSGIGYISNTLWAKKHNLTSHAQFADRIGVGYTFARSEVSINFFHFSNAGLDEPNPGSDMLLLRTSFTI